MALHCALEIAVKWGLLSRNPADAVTPPHCQRTEMHTMAENDIHNFLEKASGSQYYAMFYVSLFTGMRRSEVLALRWSDVDLMLCQISVTRSLHHLRSGELVFRQPKTAKGRRTIALSPSTALVLKEHKEQQMAQRMLLGTTQREDDLVFSDNNGRPVLPDTMSHAWVKITKRAGIIGIRLHDARHTHASLMLKQGIHPKVVQERLGHASIQTTLDTYSHVAPGLQEAAAARFDTILDHAPLLKRQVSYPLAFLLYVNSGNEGLL
jgi:integrase